MYYYFLYIALVFNSLGIDISFQSQIPSILTKTIVLGLIFLFIIFSKRGSQSIGLNRIFLLIFIYLLGNLMIAFFFQSNRLTGLMFNGMFSLILPVFILKQKFQLRKKYFLVWMSIIPMIVFFISLLFEAFKIYGMFRNEGGNISRLQCTSVPSNFAMVIFFAIFAHSCNFKGGKKSSFLYYLYLLLLFVLLNLTGARMALFCAILSSICLIMYKLDWKFWKKLFIGFVFFFLSLFLFLVNNTRNLSDASQSDIINTSGRSSAWIFFMDEIQKNKLFGIGHGNSREYFLDSEIEFFTTPHNEYIRLLLEGGGLLAVLVLVVSFRFIYQRFRAYRTVKDFSNFAILILYFATLIYSFTDNTFSTYQFFIPFLFVIKYFDNFEDEK